MTTRMFLAMVLGISLVSGQDDAPVTIVRGIRVFGETRSELPVATLAGKRITIELDLQAEAPPRLSLRFVHCTSDWVPTASLLVNDPMCNRTRFPLPVDPAPDGVRQYRYQTRVRIPDEKLFEKFQYSGNYLLEVWDEDRGEAPLAASRFFVAEGRISPDVRVRGRQQPSESYPLNQVHRIDVRVILPEPDSLSPELLYAQDLRRVDVYRNLEQSTRRRIDIDDDDPFTFVEGFGTKDLVFRVENFLPGNEYRRLDVRNVDHYPEGRVLRARGGADVSRYLSRGAADRDGGDQLVQGNRYADYLPFEFELLWDGTPDEPIFVTGSFCNWAIVPELRMKREGNRHRVTVSLRRGAYDYQYVIGGRDWTTLEGNDTRTTNTYTVLVYYAEVRLGGYDRILGFGRARSRGEAQETLNE